MAPASFNKADAAAGIFFMLLGLIFGLQALGLDFGTALRMGPGYFPMLLAVVLTGLGLAILIGALRTAGAEIGGYAWRGMLFILGAPVFFGLTVQGLGFVASIFVTTLIAALAALRMKLPLAVVVAAGVTVFSTVVFLTALGLPFRSFGPWLGQ